MKKKKNKKKKSTLEIMKKDIFKFFHKKEEKTTFSIVEVIMIILISIMFGVIVGYLINYSRNDTSKDPNLSKIVTTYNDIVNNYYDDLNKEEMSNAAIKGMVESLKDPYSNYLNVEQSDDFNEEIDGSFVGIGVEILNGEEYTTVVKVFVDSPAEKYGVKVDDQIIKVNGESVKGLPGSELAKLIRGKKKTKVDITVLRDNKEVDISLIRDVVDLESVTSNIIKYEDKSIGYIRIETFAANTYSQFYKALRR